MSWRGDRRITTLNQLGRRAGEVVTIRDSVTETTQDALVSRGGPRRFSGFTGSGVGIDVHYEVTGEHPTHMTGTLSREDLTEGRYTVTPAKVRQPGTRRFSHQRPF